MSPQELREDISVLNVVNFGGGAYVIYAEVLPTGEIEVDPEPYSDTFDRPARLLPIEAKALVAAIDLLNLAQPELSTAREKVVEALGHDPVEEGLQITSPDVADDVAHTVERRCTRAGSSRSSTGRRATTSRSGPSSRTRCSTAPRRWYVAACDLDKDRLQHFRLDRIKSAEALDEHFERRPGPRPDRRRRRLAAHGQDRRLARRPRLDLARAGALGAREARLSWRSSRTARSSSSGRSTAPTSS